MIILYADDIAEGYDTEDYNLWSIYLYNFVVCGH